jgi:uncharacterized iron-regulated membrane protein
MRPFLTARALRTWAWLHKWSSLVCTLFMLLLCITGLPLIFHHEIGHLLGTEVEPPAIEHHGPRASLDEVLRVAHARHPERMIQFASLDEEDDPVWFVTLTPTPAPTEDFRSVAVDGRTAQVLAEPRFDQGFMWVMFKLHVDLFAGLAGKLFLGFMGLLLLVAVVSGVVLYAPFMKRLDFGTVRRERSARVRWLDLHNLLGIVTLVWAFVVGATGVINTWADLMIKYWQYEQLGARALPGPAAGAAGRARADAAPVRGGCEPARGHEARVHGLPRHRVLEPAPHHLLPARPDAAHLAAAAAGAGGRTQRQRHRGAQAALVPDGAAGVAAAALRRLRRHADEDHLGAARRGDHRRAGQRLVPVVQEAAPGAHAGRRGWR